VAAESLPAERVGRFIETSLAKLPLGQNHRTKQVAFYGGSFTAMAKDDQVCYLGEVQPFLRSGRIDSIRISTRPDALDDEVLSLLEECVVQTVEVGAQSMSDQVLFLSQRGHRTADTVASIARLRERDFEVGIHLMMGLPGDSPDLFLRSIDRVIDLRPDFVRIHPTLVLKGADLETMWRRKTYSPLSVNEAIQWLKGGLLRLERASVPVARIGLQTDQELERHFLAGPYHPALHQMVESAITYDLAAHLLRRDSVGPEATFICHPKEISNLRGQKNMNLLKLKEQFHLKEIFVLESDELERGSLVLQTTRGSTLIDRKDPALYKG
jgi:histone acetyltransferase (RNA polymerase elongator complex component)